MYKQHKYSAKKTEINWIKFSSLLEARFYNYFINKNIEIIEIQPEYLLQDKFKHNNKTIRAIKYIADFKIRLDWDIYIVDAKWMETPVFAIKHKLWLKRYWSDNILIISKSIRDLEKQLKI